MINNIVIIPDVHKCNEDAVVYETKDHKRFMFTNLEESGKWFEENSKNISMGSVACSVCGKTFFDSIFKTE